MRSDTYVATEKDRRYGKNGKDESLTKVMKWEIRIQASLLTEKKVQRLDGNRSVKFVGSLSGLRYSPTVVETQWIFHRTR